MGCKFRKYKILSLIMIVTISILFVGCDMNGVSGSYVENNNKTVSSTDENQDSKITDSSIEDDFNIDDSDTEIPIKQDISDLSNTEVNDKERYIELYRQYWNTVIMPTYGIMDKNNIELKRHGNISAEEFIRRENEISNSYIRNNDDFGNLEIHSNMRNILGLASDKTVINALLVDMDDDGVPELITTRLFINQNDINKNSFGYDELNLSIEVYTIENENITLIGQINSSDLFGYPTTTYDILIKPTTNGKDFAVSNINKGQSLYEEKIFLYKLIDGNLTQQVNISIFSAETTVGYDVNDKETGVQFSASFCGSDESNWEFSGQKQDDESWIGMDMIEMLDYVDSLKNSVMQNTEIFLQIVVSKKDNTSEFYLGRSFISEFIITEKKMSPELVSQYN